MEREGRTTKRPRRVTIIVIVSVFVVLAVLAAVTSAPAVCASCHTMNPAGDALAESKHAALGCYECHLAAGWWDWPGAKIDEWTVMYPRELLGDGLSRPVVQTSSTPCLGCHAAIEAGVVEAGGFRIDHSACAGDGATCDRCHSTIAHGAATRWPRVPVMEECVGCHQRSGAPDECDTCHTGKGEQERLVRGPWQVTHGANWRETHGMGSIEYCSTCHPANYCVDCHGIPLPHPADFGRTHGASAIEDPESCETCHFTDTVCVDCHGLEMPHPDGFLAEHSTVASSPEDESCLTCHQSIDCIECHTRHAHPGRTDGTIGEPPNGVIEPVEAEVP